MTSLSPLKHRFTIFVNKFRLQKDLSEEAFYCYKNRLPNGKIAVFWKREGDFIVGKIEVENEKYNVQGKSAKEFVEMVNDTLYAAYEIPSQYISALGGLQRVFPPKEEFKKLNNEAVKKSSFVNFDLVPAKT